MPPSTAADVELLRSFNRTYTARLGLLDAHLGSSPFTLSEARILFELAHRDAPTAAEIARSLNLDRAQMSRTLKRFGGRGLVVAREDPEHGRHQLLELTPEGIAAFNELEEGARSGVRSLLDELPLHRRSRLLGAAASIRDMFQMNSAPTLLLRGLRPGDIGLIVHRQAILYAAEYGYDSSYEALIAQILADFHQTFDPEHDGAWIAELDGKMAGSIFLVNGGEPSVGKLRLLYVEPEARGAGVGKQLVNVCVERARAAGYKRLDLWTDGQLAPARRLYERAGFTRCETKRERHFGQDIESETWSLDL
jgi:DNA-binding MarR family transcriptional regulator/predicted GNAT family acetyltransferase